MYILVNGEQIFHCWLFGMRLIILDCVTEELSKQTPTWAHKSALNQALVLFHQHYVLFVLY